MTSHLLVSDDNSFSSFLIIVSLGIITIVVIAVALFLNREMRGQVADNEERKSSGVLIKVLIKLALLVVITFFALCNYRIFSFDKGFSSSLDDFGKKDAVEAISTLTSISTVEYYSKTVPSADMKYKIYVESSADNYLFDASQDDLKALSTLGIFSDRMQPKKNKPYPFLF